MRFSYDSLGNAVSVLYNGTEYYYMRNLQGDVIGLINKNGEWVVRYRYDVWGNILEVSGIRASTLGQDNPIRYRGYYYDAETGFYYVSSRYYDPGVGRFISADGEISGVGGDIRGYNMYTYCFNNPVNMSDPSGNWPTLGQIFAVAATIVSVALVAVAVIAAAPAVAGAVMSTALYYGATAGTANALATAASIGCAALAGGTALVGVNQTVETITGTNYVAKAIGEKNYDNIETAIMLTSAAVISIPQTTPYPSTGRSEPRNLNEQVGMNFARANADAGKVIFPYLHDTRMPGWLGWQKYQIYYSGTGVNIHYVGNRFIPIFFDFKFKE